MKPAAWTLGCLLIFGTRICPAQASDLTIAPPLPDIPTLMHEVETHQKASETLVKDYLYHSYATEQSQDGHGGVKKTETEESDIFYVAGVRIRRITKKDGRDLTPDEEKKESERIDEKIAKAKERQGKPTEEGHEVVTVSRFLELGSFGNARRVQMNDRDTIAVDFTGNSKAKTQSHFESAIREMEGTIWVDEQDRSLRKLQGHFVNAFKVGGGLLADVKKDSSFEAEWTKVNGEVWLPSSAAGQGAVRVLLLLNFHGSLRVVNSNYRKFKTTSTIVPVPSGEPEPASQPVLPQ